MSTSTTPDIDQVTADISDLRNYVHAIVQSFENRWQDGSDWPLMLAEIHCTATDLAERTQQLAEQLEPLGSAHPHGQLPADPSHIPVIGHSQNHFDDLLGEADDQLEHLATLMLDRHYPQLAGPHPHTVDLGTDRFEFKDATGRTVLIAFYGAQPDQVREWIYNWAITPVTIPFVPRMEGTFYSLLSIKGGGRLYDRYGKLTGDDTQPG